MSCNDDIQYWRVIQKYSTITGQVPTIPPSADHNDGTWSDTDLYVGELFMNVTDNRVWYRALDGIHEIAGTVSGTGSFVGDYVPTGGGSFSGPVYAPTFSSVGIVTGLITASAFAGPQIGTSASTIYGDGSNLTGIVVAWNGGTVSNPTQFINDLYLDSFVQINGIVNGNANGQVVFDAGIDVINGYGVSASYFIGDGSGLTNLPTGTYSDTYTTMAGLSGSTIIFDRNDLPAAYTVDLSPILSTYSISSINWNSTTSELTILTEAGDIFTETINEFGSINVGSYVSANDFYGTFHGTFLGTFSDDIYTTNAALIGTTAEFYRTDGNTYSLDLSSLAGGGGSQSLAQTLANGNSTGANWIEAATNYGVRNLDGVKQRELIYNTDGILLQTYGTVSDQTSSILVSDDKTRIYSKSDSGAFPTNEAYIETYENGNIVINSTYALDINTEYVLMTGQSAAFVGAQYALDYSANFTNRSLVDKEYVDKLVAGATPSLSDVLSFSNVTNNNDIIFTVNPFSSTSDRITALGNILTDANFSFEDLGGGAWAPTMRTQNNASTNYITVQDSDTYIHNSQVDAFNNRYGQIEVGPTSINTSVDDIANGRGTDLTITSTTMVVRHSGGTFSGIQYDADYSADYSNRSLVDKEYVDGLVVTPSLSTVLGVGNTTGNNWISAATNYGIRNTANTNIYTQFVSNGILHQAATASTFSRLRLYQDGAVQINNSQNAYINLYNNGNVQVWSNDTFDINGGKIARMQFTGPTVSSPEFAGGVLSTSDINGGYTQVYMVDNITGTEFSRTEYRTYEATTTTEESDSGLPKTATSRTWANLTQAGSEVKTTMPSSGEVTTISAQYDGSHIQNILQTTDGASTTTIAQRTYEIVVSGSSPFPGIQYLTDYSANYTSRSLVDKAYVDAVAGGGGGTASSLAQVLAIGNTASTDIDMNQYQIQNVSVIDADGNVGIHTINMINASLMTLMYNT